MNAAEFRKARRGLSLTQEQLARALGVTVQTVNIYEKGHRDVPYLTAVTLLYMVTYGLLEGLMDGRPSWRLPS